MNSRGTRWRYVVSFVCHSDPDFELGRRDAVPLIVEVFTNGLAGHQLVSMLVE